MKSPVPQLSTSHQPVPPRKSAPWRLLPALGIAVLAATLNAQDNPLLAENPLQFGYPRFDLIRNEHFRPAYEQAMAEHLREIETIAANSAAPTFENTVVALERAGRKLDFVDNVFNGLNGTLTNPELQAIEKELSPKLAAHFDAIALDPRLFVRIEAVYGKRAELGLDPESLFLVERYYKDFVRSGAKLAPAEQLKLKALNAELATLQTAFAQNVLKEVNASAVFVDSREELAGWSEAAITAAAESARADGREGKFKISLVNTTSQPPLAQLTNRALREHLQRASLARGTRGGEFDNRENVSRLARLRAERAQLLGFASHAAYTLADQTAGTVEAADGLLVKLAPAAVANARREAADLQTLLVADHPGAVIEPWDWAFYTEKVRAARYAFDEEQLRPYFEMDRVLRDGVFYAATRLYGITFKERTDLPRYQDDVRTFEVLDADGSTLALLIVDWYARPSKRGGAWASAYVSQSTLLGTHPVIGNHLNIPKPPAGEPTLMTYDEVNTAFHEFGHNLHQIFSAVKYPRFSGTSVPRDFVEFPSQVNEMWMTWPEVLANYAKHYKTGAPIPAELVAKVKAAEKFNQGYATTEYLASSLLDLSWHRLTPGEVPAADGVEAFEAAALRRAGVDFAPVPPRYRTTYFSHIFSLGYSAGYYSYVWAEVLDADTVEWFKRNGGLTRANGDRFRSMLLSRGGSAEVMDFFRAFRGGDPELRPLLERRGLAPAAN
ncbi:MAG TPA: M3 family metallopeptidase [Opitutaceae bacterium]|nr:M3 family metallopeptidase [Opitutaceae bacterium]